MFRRNYDLLENEARHQKKVLLQLEKEEYNFSIPRFVFGKIEFEMFESVEVASCRV